MNSSQHTALGRILLAGTLMALCAPAMSESFLDKLKKATDTIERSRDSAKRTIDDVNELGGSSSGKGKKGKTNSGDTGDTGESESTTMKTVNAGDANLTEGPSVELREQVGRMGGACRERSAEGASFKACADACSAASEKISVSAKSAANDEAYASCQAKYNQAMGIESSGPAGNAPAIVAEPVPAKLESGQSAMPGAG